MKKTLLIITILFIIGLTSCAYKEYSGKYANLYTVAINSVLWLNGHSWEADFECDPQIEIIDKDRYGRIMFTYYEKYYSGANLSFSALIICQDSNEKFRTHLATIKMKIPEIDRGFSDIVINNCPK